MRVLKPIVGEVSPQLYEAASRANLSAPEQVHMEQMAWSIKKNRELAGLSQADARTEFEKLDPNAQENLKYFFGKADYMQAPPDFGDRLLGALKFGAKVAASPLIGLFKVAGAYNRAINTPYLVARQVAQGKDIFSNQVWSDAWDGKDVYDSGALAQATNAFGKARVYVAQGLLAGKKPGEILDTYGDLTPDITKAMEDAFNNPDSFKQVMDGVKYAQVSFGRDIARAFMSPKPPKNGGIHGDYISGATKNVSGVLDFMYQIAIDPLTWVTGGTSKAATRGSQLAEMIQKSEVVGSRNIGVAQAFKDKGVFTLWENQLGPEIKKLSEATGEAEKSVIRRQIGQRFAGYNNDEALSFLERNKVFDAKSAEKVFEDVENVHYFLGGRVDGITYRRNGVATARNQRRMATGLSSYLDSVFNATAGKLGVRKTVEDLQAKGEDAYSILLKTGEEVDKSINPAIKELTEIDKDVSRLRKAALKVGQLAARNPAGQQIIIGEDAIKTIDTVRNYARLLMNRDLADFVAQKFLTASEDEQVVIVRNLYTGIMMRAGLDHSNDGRKLMEEVLSKTLNERAGFTTTKNTTINQEFADVLSPRTVKIQDNVPTMTNSGAIQPSQLAGAIGPLPLENIALKANEIKSKQNLMRAIGGATNSKLAKDFVDFWSIFTLFPRLGIRSAIDEGFMYALTAPGRDLLNFARGRGRDLGKSSAAYTASKDATGPFSAALQKVFNRPVSDLIGIEERNRIVEELAMKEGVSPAELSHLQINSAIAERAKVFIKDLPAEDQKFWSEAMVYHPDLLNSMASSISARTSLGGKFDEEIINSQINLSELTKALNDVGKKLIGERLQSGKYKEIQVDELRAADPLYVALAHFDNWYIRFATPRQHGALKLPQNARVSPAIAFFSNNFLRTPQDLTRAVDGMMERVGMVRPASKGVKTKSIIGGNAGKGTPMGDAKDIAMRNQANSAIVELENINRQKEILSANPSAVGKSSSETSLLKLGPATGNLNGKTIMLARNGKLANQPLRSETIAQIKSANEAGAKFVVGDMPNVDSAFIKLLDDIKADYTVFHTGTTPRVKLTQAVSDGVFKINPERADGVKKLLSHFGETVYWRNQGATDEEIVRIYFERMLMDMRDNFHGGPNNWNEKLVSLIKDKFDNLVGKETETGEKINKKWMKAAASVSMDEFVAATKGYQPTGIINTRIDFPDFTDVESVWKRSGGKMMEMMDRQVNGILRQPAVMVSYIKTRKNYSKIQDGYTQKLYKQMLEDNKDTLARSDGGRATLLDRARTQSEKRFTELAMNEAADTVLKYVDNPSIRSNFSVGVRTVGRFYRATEDFQRRIYRLKEVSPQVLYRMRLAHLGLNASGMFHKDANGDAYVLMPMDNVLFKATDTTIRTLTGNKDSEYKQPMFNDFTLKLNLVNPSFSPDAGLPTLSGPIAALSVLGMKGILGHTPVPGAAKLGQELDNYALGSIGDNMDIVRALIPSTVLKIYQTLPVNEKTRQEVTAAQQAIAYNAAHGLSLSPNATDLEKANYLKNIRITAHNIVALRSVLGLISPVSPSTQESKDVPSYLLDNGITGLRAEFWDIYDSVYKKYGDSVQDPYELAMSIFTGKNPGKLVYTVSRDTKQTKVLLSKTNDMKNWSIENRQFIKNYGEAGYIFAPHSGDFNAGVYNWMQASDLLQDKTVEQYFDDVQVAEDKQKYYDIASWEKSALGAEPVISNRKLIIAQATNMRQNLLTSNPLLLTAITAGGNEIASEERMLSSIKQIVSDTNAPIDGGTRIKMKLAVQSVEDFIAFCKDDQVRSLYNASELKAKFRQKVEANLNELTAQDPALKEATRAVFNSILKYYSRETYKAVG